MSRTDTPAWKGIDGRSRWKLISFIINTNSLLSHHLNPSPSPTHPSRRRCPGWLNERRSLRNASHRSCTGFRERGWTWLTTFPTGDCHSQQQKPFAVWWELGVRGGGSPSVPAQCYFWTWAAFLTRTHPLPPPGQPPRWHPGAHAALLAAAWPPGGFPGAGDAETSSSQPARGWACGRSAGCRFSSLLHSAKEPARRALTLHAASSWDPKAPERSFFRGRGGFLLSRWVGAWSVCSGAGKDALQPGQAGTAVKRSVPGGFAGSRLRRPSAATVFRILPRTARSSGAGGGSCSAPLLSCWSWGGGGARGWVSSPIFSLGNMRYSGRSFSFGRWYVWGGLHRVGLYSC